MSLTVTKATNRGQPLSYFFLNEHEVADATGMSVSSVRRWRLLGKGPKYFKINGAAVRYRSDDMQHWLSCQPTGGEQRAE